MQKISDSRDVSDSFRRNQDPGPQSIGHLLKRLADNSASLVRDEITLTWWEIGHKVVELRTGIATTAIGLVFALLGLASLLAAAVVGLAPYVGGVGYSALLIGLFLALAGAVTATVGIAVIKRTSLKPQHTIERLEDHKEWLKELT